MVLSLLRFMLQSAIPSSAGKPSLKKPVTESSSEESSDESEEESEEEPSKTPKKSVNFFHCLLKPYIRVL